MGDELTGPPGLIFTVDGMAQRFSDWRDGDRTDARISSTDRGRRGEGVRGLSSGRRCDCARGYGPAMDGKGTGKNLGMDRVAPVPRPPALDGYEGMWVAVIDGMVVLAAKTSHELALRLHDMDHRRRSRLVVQYVRPQVDSYIVGVG